MRENNNELYLTSDTREKDAWVSGHYGELNFSAKVFDLPSPSGINNGRVSKLFIRGNTNECPFCSYDRGWDNVPDNEDEKAACREIMDFLENLIPCSKKVMRNE